MGCMAFFAVWYNAQYAAFLRGTGEQHWLEGGKLGKDGLEKKQGFLIPSSLGKIITSRK
jgi:hypothetical protein